MPSTRDGRGGWRSSGATDIGPKGPPDEDTDIGPKGPPEEGDTEVGPKGPPEED